MCYLCWQLIFLISYLPQTSDKSVIPAQAGIQIVDHVKHSRLQGLRGGRHWIPAYAGMTKK